MTTPTTRAPRRRWTQAEDGLLTAYIGTESLPRLAKRLGRSERAVEKRAYDRGLCFGREAHRNVGLGLTQAAEALGCDNKTVWRWHRRGWIQVKTVRGRYGRRLAVAEAELCAFLARIGGLLPEVRPTDALWRDVAADARASLEARYIRAQDLVRLLGYAHHNRLLAWRRRHGFPDPALDLGERSGGHIYERAAVVAWLEAHPGYATAASRAAVAGRI